MSSVVLALICGVLSVSGFPKKTGAPIPHPPVPSTFAGGSLAVISGEELHVYRSEGSEAPGFPASLGPGETASGSPASAALGRDAGMVLAATTESGKVFLFLSNGLVAPGYPVTLAAGLVAAPAFADLDGDGKPELLIGDRLGKLHALRTDGHQQPGWPVALCSRITSSASSARFAGGTSIAVGCEDGKVHLLDRAGKERGGFPLITRFAVSGAPAFADFDNDGRLDLLVASQDFKLYAVNQENRPLVGFPFTATYRLYGGPAIADVDGDGDLDAVFGSGDGKVYAVGAHGRVLAGFPIKVGPKVNGGVALADIDEDGRLEIITSTGDGQLTAFTAGGKVLPGFPAVVGNGEANGTPSIWEAVRGELPVITFASATGDVIAWRAKRAALDGAAALAAIPWAMVGHDASRTGRYGPEGPRFRDLKMSPPSPRAIEPLTAEWRVVWPDAPPGEKEPIPRVIWERNGQEVPALSGKKQLPVGTVKRGEKWRFKLIPDAVSAASSSGAAVSSGEAISINSPPEPPVLRLDPEHPRHGSILKATVVTPPRDPDGDSVTTRIDWLADGVPLKIVADELPGKRLRRGQRATARAIASDGELAGNASYVDALVVDDAPSAFKVTLLPPLAKTSDQLTVKILESPTDPDDDPLTFRYRWRVDGKPQNLSLTQSQLPRGTVRKNGVVSVEVTAFDGELEGPTATARLTVVNSAPSAPKLKLPDSPRRGAPLRVELLEPATDADGDQLNYRTAWQKNGHPLSLPTDALEVPASELSRGDQVTVEAWASDGELEGAHGLAKTEVSNAPPGSPEIRLEPADPVAGQTIEVKIVKEAVDRDGDGIFYQITWSLDGRDVSAAQNQRTLSSKLFRKHQRVKVSVAAYDGKVTGPTVRAEARIKNAIPTMSEPVLAAAKSSQKELAPVRAGEALIVSLKTPSTDADGDAIQYRYRWYKNGFHDSEATQSTHAPGRKGERWAVEVEPSDGEATGPIARAEVVLANSPPAVPQLHLVPLTPAAGDALEAHVSELSDPDGDPVAIRYRWFKNGQAMAFPPEQGQLPRGLIKKGEIWAVEAVATDGEAASEPERAEEMVRNSPPSAPQVTLCPHATQVGSDLQAKLAVPSNDPDGDSIRYTYAWKLNGRPYSAAAGKERLSAQALQKHQVVQVEVTPSDGTQQGTPGAAECRIENTPPTAPEITLEPTLPTARTGIHALLKKPSADADGEAVNYRYKWLRDGLGVNEFTGPDVPKQSVHRGEVWQVQVVAADGESTSEMAMARAVAGNTIPPLAMVSVMPREPLATNPLTCVVTGPEKDIDGDALVSRRRWTRGEEPIPILDDRVEVPAHLTKKGEHWHCEAWLDDGFESGPHARAEVVLKNGSPSALKVTVEPLHPRAGDPLACRFVEEPRDPDGDPMDIHFHWLRNGNSISSDNGELPAGLIRKNERWQCTAAATDGLLEGPTARAEAVLVSNAPPTQATVRLVPDHPHLGQDLACEVAGGSKDPDGDAVRYRFFWYKDGSAQALSESASVVSSRLLKRGDRWRCQVIPTDGEAEGPRSSSNEEAVVR